MIMHKKKRAIPYYNHCTPYVMWASTVHLGAVPEEHRVDARMLLVYFATHCTEKSTKKRPYNMATVCNRKMERMMGMESHQLLGLIGCLVSAGIVMDHSFEWHESDFELLCNFHDPKHPEYREYWSKFEWEDEQ